MRLFITTTEEPVPETRIDTGAVTTELVGVFTTRELAEEAGRVWLGDRVKEDLQWALICDYGFAESQVPGQLTRLGAQMSVTEAATWVNQNDNPDNLPQEDDYDIAVLVTEVTLNAAYSGGATLGQFQAVES